ncbi:MULTISPECIES: hypothetical protein [unclassified Microcoleus]|uniref:hypothetical protein n=1 Tax=unclassified Microcoleus TaxID=2642155 RepID=UPI002FD237CA
MKSGFYLILIPKLDWRSGIIPAPIATPNRDKTSRAPSPDPHNLNYANVGKQQSLVTKAINIISNNLFDLGAVYPVWQT